MILLRESSGFDRIKSTLDSRAEIAVWSHFDSERSRVLVERIFLTEEKLIYRGSSGTLDLGYLSLGGQRLLSTHYNDRFPDTLKRTLPERATIWMAGSSVFKRAVSERAADDDYRILPLHLKPYLSGYNDKLHLNGAILGMNPANLEIFTLLSGRDLRAKYESLREPVVSKRKPLSASDRARVARAMERYEATEPIIYVPSVP